ncbi:MAG: histidinol-phosphate transaminase [Pontiellaceae bacterium]
MSDWIRKSVTDMQAYIPGEQPQGDEVVKLNTNENPYLPSPEVLDILREIDVADLARYPDPGCMEVRKVIADLHGSSVEQVFVGNGSDEILALAMRAFVERDEKVGFLEPSYSLYPVLAQIEDLQYEQVVLNERFNWSTPEGLETALFFLTNPNAPTSVSAGFEQIKSFAEQVKGVLLIDEAYAEFAEWNCMDLALKHAHVLVSRSLSKSYSLAGIRCGYCVGHADLIRALYKIKDSYNVNYITQEIARVALMDQETMKANVEAVKETRRLVSEKLFNFGFEVFDSQTNFLWVKPLGISASTLFQSLKQRNIFVRYFGEAKQTRDYLRISIGTAPQMFSFLDAVEEIING